MKPSICQFNIISYFSSLSSNIALSAVNRRNSISCRRSSFLIQFFQSAFKVWRGELTLQMQISRSIFEYSIESGFKLWRGYIINCDVKKYITKRYSRKWSSFTSLEVLLMSGWRFTMVLFQLQWVRGSIVERYKSFNFQC